MYVFVFPFSWLLCSCIIYSLFFFNTRLIHTVFNVLIMSTILVGFYIMTLTIKLYLSRRPCIDSFIPDTIPDPDTVFFSDCGTHRVLTIFLSVPSLHFLYQVSVATRWCAFEHKMARHALGRTRTRGWFHAGHTQLSTQRGTFYICLSVCLSVCLSLSISHIWTCSPCVCCWVALSASLPFVITLLFLSPCTTRSLPLSMKLSVVGCIIRKETAVQLLSWW